MRTCKILPITATRLGRMSAMAAARDKSTTTCNARVKTCTWRGHGRTFATGKEVFPVMHCCPDTITYTTSFWYLPRSLPLEWQYGQINR